MTLLADVVAVLHGLLVLFVAGGLVAILVGLWRSWSWTRGFWFRFLHLMVCLCVLIFELAGQPCPLTSAEQHLRGDTVGQAGYQGSFIAHYVSRTIHVDVPPQVLSGPMLFLVILIVLLYRYAGPVSEDRAGGSSCPLGMSDEPNGQEGRALGPRASCPHPHSVVRRWCLYGMTVFFVSVFLPVASWGLGHFWSGWSYLNMTLAFLLVSVLLCLPNARLAGLRLGEVSEWRRWGGWIAAFWIVPPLLVIYVYATMTSRPFKDISWANWCLSSIAQEVVFTGFVYAQLVKHWGEGSDGWRGAVRWPVIGTALAFCLWHWPNALVFDARYMVFQIAYTFLGCVWCLQMRRWTGSLLPGITNHVMVNYLASVL